MFDQAQLAGVLGHSTRPLQAHPESSEAQAQVLLIHHTAATLPCAVLMHHTVATLPCAVLMQNAAAARPCAVLV